MATNKQEQAKAIYELWDVILQHRWRFVLPAFAVTAVVLFVSLFLPRKYEAVAYFERRNAPELIEAMRIGASDSYIDPLAALTKEIAGSHAINQVITELEPKLTEIGYINNATELRTLRHSVKQQLIASRESADRAHVQLRLALVLDDPDISAMVVNALVDRYMRTTRDAQIGRAESSIAYYNSLIEEHRVALEERQRQLDLFEQKHALFLPDQPYSIEVQLGDAKKQLSELKLALESLDLQRRTLRTDLQNEPATLPSTVHSKNPELTRLESKLEKLQDKIREFTTTMRMTEQHPEVIALREQEIELQDKIASTEVNVVTSTEDHPNTKRTELELALISANVERDAIQEQIAMRNNKISELSAMMSSEMLPVRQDHRNLVAKVQESQKGIDHYQTPLLRVSQYLTTEKGDRGVQMEFISRATPVPIPVSPALVQVIIVAGFLGIASGALNVFIAHRTDESYRNARQLASTTSIPVLGSVSELITRQHQQMRRLRYSIIYPLNAFGMVCILILFGSLLYLDLQRPELLQKLKDQAKDAWATVAPTEQAVDPPASAELKTPEKPQG